MYRDPATDFLPPKARKTFRTLAREAQDTAPNTSSFYRQLSRENEKLREATDRWRRITTNAPQPPEIKAHSVEIARLNTQLDAVRQAYELSVRAYQNCQTWVVEIAATDVKLIDYDTSAMKLRRGDTLENVKAIRSEVAALSVKIEQVRSRPAPRAVLRARAVAHLDEIARRGEPRIRVDHNASTPLALDKLLTNYDAGFLVWLLRDVIEQRLTDVIDKVAISDAVEIDDREALLTSLFEDRLNLECLEELHVRHARAAGATIVRRGDADPRAVLMVAEV